jgi:hypothetical protein
MKPVFFPDIEINSLGLNAQSAVSAYCLQGELITAIFLQLGVTGKKQCIFSEISSNESQKMNQFS